MSLVVVHEPLLALEPLRHRRHQEPEPLLVLHLHRELVARQEVREVDDYQQRLQLRTGRLTSLCSPICRVNLPLLKI